MEWTMLSRCKPTDGGAEAVLFLIPRRANCRLAAASVAHYGLYQSRRWITCNPLDSYSVILLWFCGEKRLRLALMPWSFRVQLECSATSR